MKSAIIKCFKCHQGQQVDNINQEGTILTCFSCHYIFPFQRSNIQWENYEWCEVCIQTTNFIESKCQRCLNGKDKSERDETASS